MNVLVIDDDSFVRTLFESVLSQENIQVQTFSSGNAALSWVKEHDANVIVVDMILTREDGFDLIRSLRALSLDVRPYIIVFSTLGLEHDRAEALAIGADEYVSKEEGTVRQVVDKICALRLQEDESQAVKPSIEPI